MRPHFNAWPPKAHRPGKYELGSVQDGPGGSFNPLLYGHAGSAKDAHALDTVSNSCPGRTKGCTKPCLRRLLLSIGQGPNDEHMVEELAGILWRKRRLRLVEAAALHGWNDRSIIKRFAQLIAKAIFGEV